jgi:hypothetical protein
MGRKLGIGAYGEGRDGDYTRGYTHYEIEARKPHKQLNKGLKRIER